jgi:hypothetical protein
VERGQRPTLPGGGGLTSRTVRRVRPILP